jgi:hypothetical protein
MNHKCLNIRGNAILSEVAIFEIADGSAEYADKVLNIFSGIKYCKKRNKTIARQYGRRK